ncbi:hypothetical protein AB0K43_25740 [Kitasatospora sp. NPDC049258]|uniref:hypothetical protein n=1 Tax=Kitasatospora sp. NPDC049258 TaxID=3155394 RepID=UPI003446480F
MTVQELGPTAAEVEAVRAELDELLRARQYAALRERRLAEAVRSTPPPAADLLRQLDQARQLREDLSDRCRQRHDRLRLLAEQGRPADPPPSRPTGARFAGTYQQEAQAVPPPAVAAPPAPIRGARFSGVQAATPEPAPVPEPEPEPAATAPTPAPAEPGAGPRARSTEELAALAGLITDLHRRGSGTESAALTARAALALAPSDVVRLADRLHAAGPPGAAGYLARATAGGPAGQAVGTLAGLREAGLVEEAAELFHLLRAAPATRLPELLAALEQAGQTADGQTLLWEWGSASTVELARLAEQLSDAGRVGDSRALLRQAAGRPIAEVAEVCLELAGGLAVELVGEVVRLRSATGLGEFGRAVRQHPALYEALLAAVALLDEGGARTALAALRTAGLPTGPADRSPGRRRSRGRG